MEKSQASFNKEIGRRIRNHREFLGYTRESLAEKADISTQFLADIETGRKSMTVKTLNNITNSLCVSADYILTGTINSSNNDEFEEITILLDSLTSSERAYALELLKTYTKALHTKE